MSGRVCKLLRRMSAADDVNPAGLHAEWREMTARQRGAFRARHGVRFMRQRQLRRRVRRLYDNSRARELMTVINAWVEAEMASFARSRDGRDMRRMECDNPHPAGH